MNCVVCSVAVVVVMGMVVKWCDSGCGRVSGVYSIY